MNEFTETTAENLKAVRESKGMNQGQVAEILGLQNHNISKLENGTRALSPSEKAILDWYFFATLPPSITATLDLQGVLEFTADEWHIISVMAHRAGQTPSAWIRESILSYIALRQPAISQQGKAI